MRQQSKAARPGLLGYLEQVISGVNASRGEVAGKT